MTEKDIFYTKYKFIVAITKTGRVIIPKKIRTEVNIKKRNLVCIERKIPGYLLILYGKKADELIISKKKYYQKQREEFNSKNYHKEGISIIEEDFRFFIPMNFRDFALIEDDRKNWGGEVLIKLDYLNRIEVWNKERYKEELKRIYKMIEGKSLIDKVSAIYSGKADDSEIEEVEFTSNLKFIRKRGKAIFEYEEIIY